MNYPIRVATQANRRQDIPLTVEGAVAPLRNDAIERARQQAEADIAKTREDLDKNGGDINAAAPYPKAFGGLEYYMARWRYQRFHAITVADPARGYQANNGQRPFYVVLDEDRCQRYIAAMERTASDDYDAFVVKLVRKIGPVQSAALDGNHVWSFSVLTVVTEAGVTQRWKTQIRTNYSKLGKMFYQWPTILLKDTKRRTKVTPS